MKKLLRILGCAKRKTTSLTKTASCTGNNASSRIDHVDNSISMQKKDDESKEGKGKDIDNHDDYDIDHDHDIDNDINTDHKHNHNDKDKEKPSELIMPIKSIKSIKPIEPKQDQPQSDIDEGDKWLIPKDSPFITDYEKSIIDFSPNGLGKFVETIDQLPGYKTLYNKQGIKIDINMSGSPITSDFCLVKTVYKQKKSELGNNASIPNILRLMFRAEDRGKWDTVLKLVKRYEGDDKVFIIRTWAISFPLISEREGIEKRMMFNYKGIPHVFSTSVKPDYIPEEKDVVRIVNYLDIFQIFEDEENYYFTTFTQSDFKMPIPQFLMNFFLPKTSLDWFIKFQKVAAQTVLDPL